MKHLSDYILESTQSGNKSMKSSASYLSDMGFWNRYQSELTHELGFSKSHSTKSWDDLTKDEQNKVAKFRKSLL